MGIDFNYYKRRGFKYSYIITKPPAKEVRRGAGCRSSSSSTSFPGLSKEQRQFLKSIGLTVLKYQHNNESSRQTKRF